uniref:acylglycerol lipase n=1 Tax=Timema monikensis TaxID=170555 RepID=A0A7R9HSG1_9NEOP|nr:unnamed protein product [Timema monikensis]
MNSHSWVESTLNYLSQMLRPCLGYLPFIQRQHQVHPEIDKPANSKFVRLTSQRRVRVVHIVNNNTTECAHVMRLSEINVRKSNISTVHSDNRCPSLISAKTMQSNSSETLEDYWFTRWSRPLTSFESCNCSFRKSGRSLVRDSTFSKHIIIESKENFHEINVSGSVKYSRKGFVGNISLLEDYVENLLHKTLTEVFVQLSRHKNISGNFDNIHSEKSSMKIQNIGDVTVGCINPSFVGSVSEPDVLDFEGLTQIFQVEQDGLLTCKTNDSVTSTCALIMSPHASSQNGQTEYKKHSSIVIFEEDKCESAHTVLLATVSNPNDAALQTKELANSTMVTNSSREANEFNIEEESQNLNVEIRKKKCTHDNKTKLKPLLYFLHGVGSSADLWTGLVHHFTKAGFECVAPDMLGHGYSSAPDQASAYTFTLMLKDALDIFDHYVGSRKCVVIGHAYGYVLYDI